MTDYEKITLYTKLKVLRHAVNEMALFIRKHPPMEISDDELMSTAEFVQCFAETDTDPKGDRIVKHFIMRAYKSEVE